ncbi:MAG: IS21 family transposase [Georgenia sp.]
MSRVEQFESIRRDRRDEDMSIRALSEKYQVHRRTVRQALGDATPPQRKVPDRASPVMGEHVVTVRRWLEEDKGVPRKQRHTARRVWQRLVEEEGAVVAESSVRALVGQLRREIAGALADVKVPQTHAPAEEAEVDFGEFGAWVGGVWVRLWMFILRLSHSGKAVHVAYANQAQESFLDGHVVAFEALGGVPTGMVRYDNLTPAVIRVLLGRDRLENPRFIAMRSTYGFDSFFCIPGLEGAHEKGGVEGEVGRFRRRHLVPVPKFETLAELNAFMAAADAKDDDRRITGRLETVGAAAARELPGLRALPVEAFDPAQTLSCRVDARARVCVRQSYYSVPARYAGRRLQVRLGARTITAIGDGAVVATHTRSLHKYTEDLVLDHYLEVLTRKPGALAGATALVAARAGGAFTTTHEAYWKAARAALGDKDGTRALVGVLLLHRTALPAADIIAGMEAALVMGRFDPDLVAVEARRTGLTTAAAAVVVPATAPAAAHQGRPAPSLHAYDELLTAGARA